MKTYFVDVMCFKSKNADKPEDQHFYLYQGKMTKKKFKDHVKSYIQYIAEKNYDIVIPCYYKELASKEIQYFISWEK